MSELQEIKQKQNIKRWDEQRIRALNLRPQEVPQGIIFDHTLIPELLEHLHHCKNHRLVRIGMLGMS